MNWYIEKLEEIKKNAPIFSVCGDDCSVCPRFLAKSEEELKQTAEFWHKVGWRESIVSNEEIKCSGCGSNKNCSFNLLYCTKEHGVKKCSDCPQFKCEKLKNTYKQSFEKMQQCQKVCKSKEEFEMLVRAFYQKEQNMKK